MKRWLSIFMISLTLSILYNVSSAEAAVDNCVDCHHIDFQTQTIDRNAVCVGCHDPGHTSRPFITGDFTALHITHHFGGDWEPTTDQKSGCAVCHWVDLTTTVRRASCKACHTNVAHENHGNASSSGWFTDGISGVAGDDHGYIQRNLSCTNISCHGTYGAIVKKPKCTNCHSDPHGVFPAAKDEMGVTVSPNVSNPSTQSDIKVKWTFQAGDTLKKSLDGLNWSSLDIGAPTPGAYYTYTDPGITNWTIAYYKIIGADSSEHSFPVYPPGANAHTNYMENTKLCASCHVTHAADQPRLLKESTIEDLCRTCHGLANTGSRYNVDTGEIVVAGSINENGLITSLDYRPANSGAFGIKSGVDGKYYAGNHASTWNGAQVTSAHSTQSSVSSIAPGGGHNSINLTCTNCHHSHPKKNSYRLLSIGSVEAYAVNPNATEERVNYIKNMNTGCGCHRQFIADPNSGHAVANNVYMHSVGVDIQGPYTSNNPITGLPWNLTTSLPTEHMVYSNNLFRVTGSLSGSSPVQYVQNGAVVCITCHYAHGTVATGTNPSKYDINGDSLLNDESTMLKRKNKMDVCQDCHKK